MEKSDRGLGYSCLVISLIGWGVVVCGWLAQLRDYDAGSFEIMIRMGVVMLFAIGATGVHLISFVGGLVHLMRVALKKTMCNRLCVLGFALSVLYLIPVGAIAGFMFAVSDDEGPSRYGSDTRWKQYAETRESPSKEIELQHPRPLFMRFTVSRDRARALYWSVMSSPIHLIDLDSGKELLTLEGRSTQCVAFSPDGKKAVSGGGDGVVRVWDMISGEQLADMKGHSRHIRSVAYSRVEEKVLSGGDGDSEDILLWDLEKRQVIRRFVGHRQIRFGCLAWAQDGRTFLSGGWDGSIRLWDVQTSQELCHVQPMYGRVMSLALSPRGTRALASYLSGPDQPVVYWDLETGQEIGRFGVPGNPWFADQQLHVSSVAFSADGKTALFGLVFGTVLWWDLDGWKQISMNRLHEEELVFVTFSADGKTCISVGTDADGPKDTPKVKFWKLPDDNNQMSELKVRGSDSDESVNVE